MIFSSYFNIPNRKKVSSYIIQRKFHAGDNGAHWSLYLVFDILEKSVSSFVIRLSEMHYALLHANNYLKIDNNRI